MVRIINEKNIKDFIEILLKTYNLYVSYNISQRPDDESAYIDFMFEKSNLNSRDFEFITCFNARFLRFFVGMSCVDDKIFFTYLIPNVYEL